MPCFCYLVVYLSKYISPTEKSSHTFILRKRMKNPKQLLRYPGQIWSKSSKPELFMKSRVDGQLEPVIENIEEYL